MTIPDRFNAFRIHHDDTATAAASSRSLDELTPGEVVIRAEWSVNYKDALAGTGKGRILRRSRWSAASTWPARGRLDRPDLQGRRRGAGHRLRPEETLDGGYASSRASSRGGDPAAAGHDPARGMMLGTAGFTAALALSACWKTTSAGVGPIAVTGATGGVGSSRSTSSAAPASRSSDHRQGRPRRLPQPLGARECSAAMRWRQRGRWNPRIAPAPSTTSAAPARRPVAQSAPTATSPAAAWPAATRCNDGDALHHPRRLAAGHRLRRHRARHPRGDLAPPGQRLEAGAPGPICTREVGLEELPEVFPSMLAGGSFGRTIVKL